MSPIRLIIADDELLFRKCLLALVQTAPDIDVVGEAVDSVDMLNRVRELRPDVVLLDLTMLRMDSISAINVIKQEFPETRILILTDLDDDDRIILAFKSGALGCMLKDSSPDELLTAIRSVHQGKSYLHPPIASQVLTRLNRRSDFVCSPGPLTRRQREVLTLVAQGYSNLEIADKLVITEHTASKHVGGILDRLHLTHRVQAALYAVQHGQSYLDSNR